jgi:hypothetical protein
MCSPAPWAPVAIGTIEPNAYEVGPDLAVVLTEDERRLRPQGG